MGRARSSAAGAALAVLLFLDACHDAPRRNPFDPELTPPVELAAVLDEAAGAVALSWTRYAGSQPFAEYRVVRKVQGMEADTALAAIGDPDQTAYLDSALAPGTPYEYRVLVANTGGHLAASSWQKVPGYHLAGVELFPPHTDAEAGTLTLRWRSFQGPRFEAYRLFRRQAGTDRVEALAELPQRGDTTCVDAEARHGVTYAYTVIVAAAGQELASPSREHGLELPPVSVSARLDSRTATAAVAWTAYAGPHFQAYQVRRQMAREAGRPVLETVFQTGDSARTAWVDSGLYGATDYRYQVVVITTRGEEMASGQAGGAIHAPVAEWPLPLSGSAAGTGRDQVRLYGRPAGGVAVLLATPHALRLLSYGAGGQRLEELVLLGPLPQDSQTPRLPDPRVAALAWVEGRGGLLTFGAHAIASGLAVLDAGGSLLRQVHEPFADALSEPLTGDRAVVQGTASVVPVSGAGHFSGLTVTAGDSLLWQDRQGGPLFGAGVARSGTSWRDFVLAADLYPGVGGRLGIRVGWSPGSSFRLTLDVDRQQARLEESFTPAGGTVAQTREWAAPLPVVPYLPYRLLLGVVEGQVRAAIESPVTAAPRPAGFYPNSLALMGDDALVTFGDTACLAGPDGRLAVVSAFEGWVSETRAWQVAGERAGRAAVCLPDRDRLLWGQVSRASAWSQQLRREIGPRLGSRAGSLYYPLSMAGSPDGRLYVLDAGNGRIVVLDREGQYLTEWGLTGAAAGEFDFGPGGRLWTGRDYAGSVAVDADGSIYVADPGNRRIQKFAP